MRLPTFVEPLSDDERRTLQAGLRSPDAFVLRRCQIVLASARGERAPAIARAAGCSTQTVHTALRAWAAHGPPSLTRRSSRPRTIRPAFSAAGTERLRALLHQSPRTFDKPTSAWTLDLAAAVSCEQGLTRERVTGETVRATLARLGLSWQRAKRWLTSPDPEYARKKDRATA
jgi:transposase